MWLVATARLQLEDGNGVYAPSRTQKDCPFQSVVPALQNANVRCLVFDITPQAAGEL
jgi:hypothetical protein